MLISMPTGNSKILGAFQNIFLLHVIIRVFAVQVAPNANLRAFVAKGYRCRGWPVS
jgi:hypothetical protein